MTSLDVCEGKRTKDRNPASDIIIYGEGFVSKRRLFDLPECRDCIYKVPAIVGVNVLITSGEATGFGENTYSGEELI